MINAAPVNRCLKMEYDTHSVRLRSYSWICSLRALHLRIQETREKRSGEQKGVGYSEWDSREVEPVIVTHT